MYFALGTIMGIGIMTATELCFPEWLVRVFMVLNKWSCYCSAFGDILSWLFR
jgi:hypothetical protein